MTKQQQMQVRKLHKQQAIKLAVKQTSAEARISALEAQLGIISQPEESGIKKIGDTPTKPVGGGTARILQ